MAFRKKDGAKLGGVCTGFEARTGLDRWFWRILFLLPFHFGVGCLVYLGIDLFSDED